MVKGKEELAVELDEVDSRATGCKENLPISVTRIDRELDMHSVSRVRFRTQVC